MSASNSRHLTPTGRLFVVYLIVAVAVVALAIVIRSQTLGWG
jgi:hypothetical protein